MKAAAAVWASSDLSRSASHPLWEAHLRCTFHGAEGDCPLSSSSSVSLLSLDKDNYDVSFMSPKACQESLENNHGWESFNHHLELRFHSVPPLPPTSLRHSYFAWGWQWRELAPGRFILLGILSMKKLTKRCWKRLVLVLVYSFCFVKREVCHTSSLLEHLAWTPNSILHVVLWSALSLKSSSFVTHTSALSSFREEELFLWSLAWWGHVLGLRIVWATLLINQ